MTPSILMASRARLGMALCHVRKEHVCALIIRLDKDLSSEAVEASDFVSRSFDSLLLKGSPYISH